MKRHPLVGVLALGAFGVAAATAFGIGELTFDGALAYAGYKVVREGEPPIQAFEEMQRHLGAG